MKNYIVITDTNRRVVVSPMIAATGLASALLQQGIAVAIKVTDEPVTHRTSRAAQAYIDVQDMYSSNVRGTQLWEVV